MHQATLRLFNAIQIASRQAAQPDADAMRGTIADGFLLDPSIPATPQLLATIRDIVGISGEKANATFHKSWEKVRSADIEQLVVEQVLHYITTYGFAAAGIYDSASVYIPNELLELPEIAEDLPVTIIQGLTADEIRTRIVQLGSGVALHEQTLADIMTVVEANGFDSTLIENIGNHELLARLYDHFGTVPAEPTDFLRYLIFKVTGTSLLIKSKDLIALIKDAEEDSRKTLDQLIPSAPADLAAIFYRFKPIFLALKSISTDRGFFNRLRKRAVKLHRPLPTDYLNSITNQIALGKLDLKELVRRLENATVFRKTRLAHALNDRLSAGNSIVYTIRNGRGWATNFKWRLGLKRVTKQALDLVLASLLEDLKPQVDGKTIFVPSYVNYALPTSEKQFAGPFPTGSYIETSKDTVFGVHWVNSQGQSTDLDLSLLSAAGKTGWDAAFRSDTARFSGDITDAPAPDGATELFHVSKGISPNLVCCNYYNYSPSHPVDAKIIVAQEAPEQLTANYMVDVNNIVASANIQITRKQTVLGLVATKKRATRFYFGNVSIGCNITAEEKPFAAHARDYLYNRFTSCLDLKTLLQQAGAQVVSQRPTDSECIDLSPERLTKMSILELFQGAV